MKKTIQPHETKEKKIELTEAELKLGKIVSKMMTRYQKRLKKEFDKRTPTLVPKGQVRVIRLDTAMEIIDYVRFI